MSGGHFDYKQHYIQDIIDEIEDLIKNNNVEDEWGYSNDYSDEIIEKFKVGLKILKQAEIYAQRIDWLVSGDDGEETFIERLNDDLGKINKK
jgi:hypothetical protein